VAPALSGLLAPALLLGWERAALGEGCSSRCSDALRDRLRQACDRRMGVSWSASMLSLSKVRRVRQLLNTLLLKDSTPPAIALVLAPSGSRLEERPIRLLAVRTSLVLQSIICQHRLLHR
jgi:hypothetical protein